METAIFGYVLVTIAGIGGAGLVRAGEGGLPAGDDIPTPAPKGPFGTCFICPIITGAALALILWIIAGPPRPDEVLLGAPLVGLAGGAAGATLYRAFLGGRRSSRA